MEHNKTVNNEQNWLCKLKEFEELPVSWQSGKLTFFWKMPADKFFYSQNFVHVYYSENL